MWHFTLLACVGVHTELKNMLVNSWRSLSARWFGGKYIAGKRLEQLLQLWGSDDDAESNALQSANKSELSLTLLGQKFNARELKEIFQVGFVWSLCVAVVTVVC